MSKIAYHFLAASKVIGVLTHLDAFRENKQLRKVGLENFHRISCEGPRFGGKGLLP